CVAACPIFQKIAQLNATLIDLRFVHRAQQVVGRVTEPPAGDIRSTQLGKILVKGGGVTPERIGKALLTQEEERTEGCNGKVWGILAREGGITEEERDKGGAVQAGYQSIEDWDAAVAEELQICGAARVPQLVFLSEDWFECERYGERTLARYRARITQKHQGP